MIGSGTNQGILTGRNILITGGTGFLGKRLAKACLEEFDPNRVVIFSRDDMKQSIMREEDGFQDERLRFFIGDIRDQERLYRALNGVDIVIHTAAMRRIIETEYNPFEAVKTNIIGTKNLIEACIEQGVLRIIALSQDEAVNPVSLYGGTKFVSEKLFIDGNIYGNNTGVRFSNVRLGDVIGAKDNIFYEINKKISKKNFTFHDYEMSRFFIKPQEALQFIFMSLEMMVGGEIFVPKIPSFKVLDVVKKFYPHCKIKIVPEPSVKCHEILISDEEAKHTFVYKDFFVIYPQFSQWKIGTKGIKKGEVCPTGFFYSSNCNSESMSIDEVVKLLKVKDNDII
jgi:UDP-N-acetylglucosamine 4,6-dehydratase/5-epimerase